MKTFTLTVVIVSFTPRFWSFFHTSFQIVGVVVSIGKNSETRKKKQKSRTKRHSKKKRTELSRQSVVLSVQMFGILIEALKTDAKKKVSKIAEKKKQKANNETKRRKKIILHDHMHNHSSMFRFNAIGQIDC